MFPFHNQATFNVPTANPNPYPYPFFYPQQNQYVYQNFIPFIPQTTPSQNYNSHFSSKYQDSSMVDQVNPIKLNVQTAQKKYSCNCTSTQCKKQYCVCFKNGQACGSKCSCNHCKNTSNHFENYARKDTVSCNCKKSECAKKYCQCFAKGQKCGEQCNCTGCRN